MNDKPNPDRPNGTGASPEEPETTEAPSSGGGASDAGDAKAPEPKPADGEGPAESKPSQDAKQESKPSQSADSEEARKAKIAAAKAKAAAAKEAKGDEPPKPPWEEKPVPPGHEDAADDEDVAALAEARPDAVVAADRFAGDVTVTVPLGEIVDTCTYLRDEREFSFLVDLTAADWPEREEGRFDVIYWMHRFRDSKRLRLRVVAGEDQPVPSVVSVWTTANWMEREVYDMFGVIFEGHPNLERILTWEGFNGHPLRKDFPVEGIDTGAAIYPDTFPPGGGPVGEEETV